MQSHDAFEEFVIQIGPRVDTYFPVTVLRSPAGTGGNGRFPVRDFLHGAPAQASGVGTSAGVMRDVDADDQHERLPPEQIGRDLFEALFTPEIASLFERSLGRASAVNQRLRIRLHLNVDNESIAPLAALPWELMFRHDRRSFLALSPETTFVRSLDVPIDLYELKPVAGSVRVLFVMSNPKGDLNLAAERKAIEARIAEEMETEKGQTALVAEFLENATYALLEEKLHRDDFSIIHFMGHGAMSAEGEGHLLFHDGLRSGRDLGELLKSERMTRLVTLNACNSGAASIASGADPFAGVATALVMAGVPAVIAMQFPVSDAAAIAFSTRLYTEIGAGRSIESSVDSGRRKIKALRPDQHEWATPVLFLRDPTLSPLRTAQQSTHGTAQRRAEPTGDVIVTRPVQSHTPTPAAPEKEARPAPVIEPRQPVTQPTIAPAPAPAKSTSRWGKNLGIAAAAVIGTIVLLLMIPDGESDGTTTPADSAVAPAAVDGSAPTAPLWQLNYPEFSAAVGVTHVITDGVRANPDGTSELTVNVGDPIHFEIPFTISKNPPTSCGEDLCPVRLHLIAMPPVDGENQCHRDVFRREESTSRNWEGTLKAPLDPGKYPLVIVMSNGAGCNIPENVGQPVTLMTIVVR